MDTIELDTKINIPAKDNIKLIKFSNAAVDNAAVEDGRIVDITEADPKLDILVNNFNNTVLNKDRDVVVNKVVGVVEVELSSIDAGITVF